VADTLNQVFMYLSLRLSSRKPDRQHQFGYGEKRFFWALIAAVGIFVAGAGFSLFEAYRAFFAPSADSDYLINYVVFGFAALIEGVSWVRAFRQTRGEARARHRSVVRHIRMSSDPSAKTVASEDTVAVIGDLLGLAATGLQQATGQTFWDGVAALIIMAMLVFVAFALANDNMDLLIGEAIEPDKEEGIRRIIGSEPGIEEVSDVRTTRIGALQVLVAARVGLRRDLDGAKVEELAREIDRKIRGEFPEVTLVFVDPSRRRDEWAELFAAGQARRPVRPKNWIASWAQSG
jgi:cation diffusion facilitator family transporter